MDAYVTVTNAGFYEIIREDAAAGETNWTLSRHARPGDLVLLYVAAPVMAVVAAASVATPPVRDTDPRSPWLNSYLADMSGLRLLAPPLTRAELLAAFPAWGYWRQPRQSVRVPDHWAAALNALLAPRDPFFRPIQK